MLKLEKYVEEINVKCILCNKTLKSILIFFLTLISYTVSMVHLSSHLMFPIKYAFFYKTRRQ
jgi:hypothetical protein